MTPTTTPALPSQSGRMDRSRSKGAVRSLLTALDGPWPARLALLILLTGTGMLYLIDLGASGYANTFYAAAVQAGTQSWKAMFFGSLDAGNAITVDKPPASLWVMALSGRIFGFSSWSMLAPQALEGVAAVALLYATVRRWHGTPAGLIAGAVLALTPVAALMFRFNNPDALLVLLLVAGAYCTVRAVEKGATGWLLLAGVAVGIGFLTKMMQAFLVLPAFGLVYLIAAPVSVPRRLLQLAAAAGAVVVSAGWWVAATVLWPAGARPYIGGSTTNSVLDLAFGYNGLSRLLGGSGRAGGRGGPGGAGMVGNVQFGGSAGITRLFGPSMGTEISWLLPAALIGLAAGLWLTRHANRGDRTRAALLLWGGWLLVSGLVFSFMTGTVHPYYTVALAPAIAALVAIAGRELWRGRIHLQSRAMLALMVVVTGIWDVILLSRTSSWHPELRYVLLAATAVAGGGLVLGVLHYKAPVAALPAAIMLAGLGGTAAWAVATAATLHGGPVPTSGPAVATSERGFGGGGRIPLGRGEMAASGPLVPLVRATSSRWAAATIGAQGAASLELSSGKAVMAIGGFTGSDPSPTLAQFQQYVASGQVRYFIAGGPQGGIGEGPGGGRFGPPSTRTPARGAAGASGIRPAGGPGGLRAGGPGGFQAGGPGGFQAGGPGGFQAGGPGRASGSSREITTWVQSHFKGVTVGAQTVYDLTQPTS